MTNRGIANSGIFDVPVTSVRNTGLGAKLGSKKNRKLFLKSLVQGVGISIVQDIEIVTISATGSSTDVITGTATTTDATATDLIIIPLTARTVVAIDAIVVAANVNADNADSFFLKGLFKNIAGAATEIVNEDTLNFIEDVGVLVTLVASGPNVKIQVTGLTATTFKWLGRTVIVELKY
uniref:Uncharacterized protein n=1 Tax=Marseillevirus LCMAC102 TaxID=2506603 RepID=A0A481YTZ4_9VIRU|nr:MAG: hypothetical protein LCMAC102_02120 [Marseillevirus LCMAC102]